MARTNDLGRPTGAHWGRYDSASVLPNAAASSVQTSQLDQGDLASVAGALYRCTDPSEGAATWEAVPVQADLTALVMNPHSVGVIYITSSAATTPLGAGTPLKAAGTTALSPDLTAYEYDMPAANRLRYTGTADRVAHIAMSVSAIAGGNNKVLSFYIAKNDTVLAASRQRRLIGTGSDVGSTAIHAACDMSTNDYLEVWVANDTDTATITLTQMNLFAMAMDKG